MTRLERNLAEYGSYHSDARNEATHALGIPMIVLAVLMWTARVQLGAVAGVTVDLGLLLLGVGGVFYILFAGGLGVAMFAALGLLYALGAFVLGANPWLALALFAAGWALQFVGHYFEGKRPAFFHNAMHLLVGPIWILNRAFGSFAGRRAE